MKNLACVTMLGGMLLACSSNASGHDPMQAPPPRARAEERPTDGYRVQLGIFTQRQDAQRSRDSFAARLGGELPGIAIVPSDSTGLYRVASPPMTANEAEVACAKLIAEHHNCAVVKR